MEVRIFFPLLYIAWKQVIHIQEKKSDIQNSTLITQLLSSTREIHLNALALEQDNKTHTAYIASASIYIYGFETTRRIIIGWGAKWRLPQPIAGMRLINRRTWPTIRAGGYRSTRERPMWCVCAKLHQSHPHYYYTPSPKEDSRGIELS